MLCLCPGYRRQGGGSWGASLKTFRKPGKLSAILTQRLAGFCFADPWFFGRTGDHGPGTSPFLPPESLSSRAQTCLLGFGLMVHRTQSLTGFLFPVTRFRLLASFPEVISCLQHFFEIVEIGRLYHICTITKYCLGTLSRTAGYWFPIGPLISGRAFSFSGLSVSRCGSVSMDAEREEPRPRNGRNWAMARPATTTSSCTNLGDLISERVIARAQIPPTTILLRSEARARTVDSPPGKSGRGYPSG